MANKTITFGADLLPNSTAGSYNLGNSTQKWQINGVADPKLTDTTYSTGTTDAAGITKLYTSIGTATDGTMTQAAIKSALDAKMDMRDDLSPISTDRINEICGYSYQNLIAEILEAIEMALINKLTAIADSIRSKTGDTGTMTLDEMPTKIDSISTVEQVEWHQCPIA